MKTIGVECSCNGRNPNCVLCEGSGERQLVACRRCQGAGVEGGANCLDCRGQGWRGIDQIDPFEEK